MTFKIPRLPVNWDKQPQLFERMWNELANASEASAGIDTSFITVHAEPGLTGNRVLSVDSADLSVTDEGAGDNIILGLSNTGVAPGSYGDSSHVVSLTVDNKGRISNVTETSIPVTASGPYSPTKTNVSNVASSAVTTCNYMRVGSVVTVSGMITIQATTANTVTQIDLTLPIISNFSAAENCAGVIASTSLAGQCGGIYAETSGDKARIQVVPTVTASQTYTFHFTYQII